MTAKHFDRVPKRGRRLVLAANLAVASILPPIQPASAAEPVSVKIAVFNFELVDRSAGGGIIARDAVDIENLALSAEQARRQLTESGRYSIIDASSAGKDVAAAGGIPHCNGCEAPLARELGAEQSMAGIVTRVTRTEYTLQILVRDVRTGDVISNDFTGLRMGTNDSWPRGVRSLIKNRVLSEERPK